MKLQLSFTPERLAEAISHTEAIMLTGSCFAENIGNRLKGDKFRVFQNPNGILYDPVSITGSIISYIENKKYSPSDLVIINDLWHSWQHHGSFGGMDQAEVLNRVNNSQQSAHEFLRDAEWIFITLGSAYHYRLSATGAPVANCHKAPANSFIKQLLSIEQIQSLLDTCIHRLFHFNPRLRIIFTVSPVRYIRDGLVANNLSKARLTEVVQHLVNKFSKIYYFPAYELVNDVLRDYRFFKEDLVHPTDQAINFVYEQFRSACFDTATYNLTTEISRVVADLNHRPLHPGTPANIAFNEALEQKLSGLKQRFPYLDFDA